MNKLIVAGLLATSVTVAQAAQPVVDFTSTNGSFLDDNTRMIGWQFAVPEAVNVTALGWFDWGQDGLARSHEVGIWDSATQALVATVVVQAGTASALDGWFRWAELDAPVKLQAGVNYRIAGLDIGAGGDPHVWDNFLGGYNAHVTGLSVHAAVQMGGPGTAIGGLASGFGYPATQIGDARGALFGPNLAVSAVPEPATGLMMLGGAVLLAQRRRARAASATSAGPR